MTPTFAEGKPPSDTLKPASSYSRTSGSAAPGASPLASAVPLWSPSHLSPGPEELARRSRAKRIRKGTFGEGVTARPPSDRQGWYWLHRWALGAHSPLRARRTSLSGHHWGLVGQLRCMRLPNIDVPPAHLRRRPISNYSFAWLDGTLPSGFSVIPQGELTYWIGKGI